MKTKTVVLVLTVLLVSFLTGCVNLDSVVRDVGGLISDDGTEGSDSESSSGGGKSSGSNSGGGLFGKLLLDQSGMLEMQDSMVALTVYSAAFVGGGFASGYDDFAEGQGVVWRVTSADGEETNQLDIERALLKRDAGGSWWFLAYEADGDRLESEAYLDEELTIMIFRYRDPDTGDIRVWRPEPAEQGKTVEREETEETVDESTAEFYDGQWQDYVVGTETVRVPAGSYSAEHVVISEPYEDGSGEFTYEWWLAEEVPGKLAKYDWTDTSDGTSMTGELVEIRNDYRTVLGSF